MIENCPECGALGLFWMDMGIDDVGWTIKELACRECHWTGEDGYPTDDEDDNVENY